MKKIVSINSKRFLGAYLNDQARKSNFEDKFLLWGTVAAFALPPVISLAYLELIPLAVYAGVMLSGGLTGKFFYERRLGERLCVFAGQIAGEQLNDDDDIRKAA